MPPVNWWYSFLLGCYVINESLRKEIKERIDQGENFAFETTLSGRGHLKRINHLKTGGWQVELIYLALPNVEMSKLRVAERVAHGGHDIPIKAIERRFPRSLYNLLTDFGSAVDHCVCFMNDSDNPVLVFEQQGQNRDILHEDYLNLLSWEAGL